MSDFLPVYGQGVMGAYPAGVTIKSVNSVQACYEIGYCSICAPTMCGVV